MASLAHETQDHLNRETLTISVEGRAQNLGRQHIIDVGAQVGWLITDAAAHAVQDRILAKGWIRAVREATYSADPVDDDIRNFAGGYGADVEFWLEIALRDLTRFGAGPNDTRIGVMQGLIARRAAASMKVAA
jgi:hypothetical protein